MGAQQTSGPIIVNGKVISGRGCEPEGGPDACVITAHDATTGKELWRTHTIPQPGEPGNDTWGNVPYEERRHVGTWMVPSYDPELNLIIVGTSVTSPAPKYMLGGSDQQAPLSQLHARTERRHGQDRLVLPAPRRSLGSRPSRSSDCSSIRRSRRMPREVRWINPTIKSGERRKVITGVPGKTGLSTRSIGRPASSCGRAHRCPRPSSAGSTARPARSKSIRTRCSPGWPGRVFVCPNTNGGKNWEASAYSPLTNAMYVPLQNTCAQGTAVAESRKNTSLYGVAYKQAQAAPNSGGNVGTIYAISAETVPPGSSIQQLTDALNINDRGEIYAAGVPPGVPPQDVEALGHVVLLHPRR